MITKLFATQCTRKKFKTTIYVLVTYVAQYCNCKHHINFSYVVIILLHLMKIPDFGYDYNFGVLFSQ